MTSQGWVRYSVTRGGKRALDELKLENSAFVLSLSGGHATFHFKERPPSSVVAQERIRDWADTAPDPESGFAAGRLVQLERDRMAAARAAWPDVWKRLDEAARKAVS